VGIIILEISDNRILFGGGRNLDFANETTTAMEQRLKIQSELETSYYVLYFTK
jgi:hypothetical protein